ncbi:hypothetical protein RZS08_29415, partial [Arthrospira platensis SPKY1]|nr:hypothetical protein [Arthrospira platensis SPKY1]
QEQGEGVQRAAQREPIVGFHRVPIRVAEEGRFRLHKRAAVQGAQGACGPSRRPGSRFRSGDKIAAPLPRAAFVNDGPCA